MSVRILMQQVDAAGGGVGAGDASAAPSDDALAPGDPADIEEAEEGKFDDEAGGDPEPKKPAAETRSPAPAKKPEPKKEEKKPAAEKKPASEAKGEGDEEPEPKPEEEKYAYEWDEPGADGQMVRRKEELTKGEVNKILARRRKLDSESFARITEANKLRGPVEQLFKQIKDNPLAIFDLARHAGVDPHVAASKYAEEWKRQQDLTPEQRAFEEQQADLARQRAEIDTEKGKIAKEKADKDFAEKRGKVLKNVTGALDAAKMPRHPTVLQLVGDHLAAQVRGQADDFEPDYAAAVDAAQDGIRDGAHAWIGGLTYEQLVQEFPEAVKAIRAGDAARVKGGPVVKTGTQPPPRTPPPKKEEPKKFLSPQEWGEKMRAGD